MDKLDSMKVFIAVAREGKITGAAEFLGLSKAMVSKHIVYLEEMLNCQLLHRNSRGVRLTELGEKYRNECKHILAQIEEAENQISQHNQQPKGKLKVTAPISFGTYHLAPKIANYEKIYPDVNVELSLEDRIIDLVDEGIDLAIRVGNLEDSSLIARKLTETKLVICAAPGYLERCGTPRKPADLKDHNCLIYKPSDARDEWVFKGYDGEFFQTVAGDFVANIGDALRVAAIKERGLAQLTTYVVNKDLEQGNLTTVLDEYQPDPLPIYAVYPERKNLSATVRKFIDYLVSCYEPVTHEAG